MPKIGPDTWQMGLSYFWWRQFLDGHTEQEFNLETGQIRPFGQLPEGLKKVGWFPITPDLAQKMRPHGEFGFPAKGIAAPVVIELAPGEELVQFKDHLVQQGSLVHCQVCGYKFLALKIPGSCPHCQAEPLQKEDRVVSPFKTEPAEWESTDYIIGIKGKFVLKFNSTGLVARSI